MNGKMVWVSKINNNWSEQRNWANRCHSKLLANVGERTSKGRPLPVKKISCLVFNAKAYAITEKTDTS